MAKKVEKEEEEEVVISEVEAEEVAPVKEHDVD